MTLEKRIQQLVEARQSAQGNAYGRTPDSVIEERLRQIEAKYLDNVPLPQRPEGKVCRPALNVTSSAKLIYIDLDFIRIKIPLGTSFSFSQAAGSNASDGSLKGIRFDMTEVCY